MISIRCTSCKKTLEVDEQTLSNREASVVRCPGCGVTLTIDKRKTSGPVVTGPVVKVAIEGYKALLAQPSSNDLAPSGEFGSFVSVVASMYGDAEGNLQRNAAISARIAELSANETRARDALDAMRVGVPATSSAEDKNDVEAAPDEGRLDRKIHDLADYLTATSTITDVSRQIWRNVTAPHSYAPIVEWQPRADSAVDEAYADAARRSPRTPQRVRTLHGIATEHDSLVNRHHQEDAALQKQLESRLAGVQKLNDDVRSAQRRRDELEQNASSAGFNAMKAGGCAILIVATIIAAVVASAIKEDGAAGIAFFLTLGGISSVAYRFAFNRNKADREAAQQAWQNAQSALSRGERDLESTRKNIEAHRATAPESVSAIIPGDWSLLTCNEFEPGGGPRVAAVSDAIGPRMLHARTAADPTAPALQPLHMPIPATASATAAAHVGVGAVAQVTSPRAVGFRPPGEARPTATLTAIPAVAPDVIEPAITPLFQTLLETEPDAPRRRLIIVAVTALVIIAVASYFIWASAFSLEARLKKALAAGQIFAPSGTCVYDLYKEELSRNASSRTLAQFGPIIQSTIAPPANDAFARWYKDSDDTVNWPELERTYEFLSIIDPATGLHRMRQLYAAAQQNIDARDYLNAIRNYEEALKLDPSWVLALNGIGKVYMIERSPNYNERLGVAYYERACSADPQFTWAAKNLGDYYARTDDYVRAEHYLRRALATSPERPSILRALGNVCRRMHRPAEATAFYERALTFEKDPDKVAAILKALSAIRRDR